PGSGGISEYLTDKLRRKPMSEKRILIVEDDPDGQEMVSTMLRHMKYAVDTADDGNQASSILASATTNYSAIVIDLALPGKDGWQLLSEILENPSTEDVPCIAVTAFHNSKLREQALH